MKRLLFVLVAASVMAAVIASFWPHHPSGNATRPARPVRVVDNLVHAGTVPALSNVQVQLSGGPALHGQSQRRRHPAAPRHRSLLARLFFGDGERRPRPFPRP